MNATINCRGRLLNLARPKVMGILNVTPDSFFDGGKYTAVNAAVIRAAAMLEDGADIIDIGGYSSRPGAADISVDEELNRVIPVILALRSEHPESIISIDTFRSLVAREAVKAGASIVNDISAGILDADMLAEVVRLRVPYIMMHMRGTPKDMQQHANYTDIIGEMLYYFSERISEARKSGISDLIIDPGFGFAKTAEQNFQVLRGFKQFAIAGLPLLAGLSRKSMIWKTLDISKDDALNGTTALNMMALMHGANILRVHDVKETVQCVKLFSRTFFTDDDKAHFAGS